MDIRNRKVPKGEELNRAFKALADPTRRALLAELAAGAQPVGELAAGFQMSRPAISKHLKLLRQAGLVDERRRGRENLHRLSPEPLAPLVRWLEELAAAGRSQARGGGDRPRPRPADRRPAAAAPSPQGAAARRPAAPSRPPATAPPPAAPGDDWRCW